MTNSCVYLFEIAMQQQQRYGFEFPQAQKSGKSGCNSFTVTRAVTMYTNASLVVKKKTLKPQILGGVTKVNAAWGGVKKLPPLYFPVLFLHRAINK